MKRPASETSTPGDSSDPARANARPDEPVAPSGWLFLDPDAVPARWRARGVSVVMVPLTASEARDVLDAGTAVPGLEPLDEPLARLLARGASIENVAERLAISRRTAQRRVATLRRRLGARSKTELERLLAARGF